ncbi:MAG: hypothetical protein AB1744_09750, partial [Candidatus Zixiibacteriota bacterium]
IHKGQIIRQICEQNPAPVPNGMVEEYLDAIVQDEKDRDPNADEANIRTEARPTAENTLRWHILYLHIAAQEKIQVSAADTDRFVRAMAAEHKIPEEEARRFLVQTGKLTSVRDTLLEEKVLDFLIGRAKVVTAPADDKNVQDKKE